jgi:hypothetical protein
VVTKPVVERIIRRGDGFECEVEVIALPVHAAPMLRASAAMCWNRQLGPLGQQGHRSALSPRLDFRGCSRHLAKAGLDSHDWSNHKIIWSIRVSRRPRRLPVTRTFV